MAGLAPAPAPGRRLLATTPSMVGATGVTVVSGFVNVSAEGGAAGGVQVALPLDAETYVAGQVGGGGVIGWRMAAGRRQASSVPPGSPCR